MSVDLGETEKGIMRACLLLGWGLTEEEAIERLAPEHGRHSAFLYVKAAKIINADIDEDAARHEQEHDRAEIEAETDHRRGFSWMNKP